MTGRPSTMDTSPLVSVIIPCYNGIPWVEHAIHSILRQTYPNIEVIVVDDGSTDDSRAVIEAEFGDAVKVIGIANSGPGAARNVALESASGEFVQYLDADNVLTAEKIERSMDCFREHPDTDIVFTAIHLPESYDFVDESEFTSAEFQRTVDGMIEYAYEKQFPGTGMPALETSQPLYRSRVLHENGAFDETLVVLDDYELVCRQILCGARVRHVPMVGVIYRDHPGERWTSKLRYDQEVYYRSLVKLIELVHAHGQMSGAIKDFAVTFLVWELALDCVREGKPRNAERYVSLAKDISPQLPGPVAFRALASAVGTIRALAVWRVVLDVYVRAFPARARAKLGPVADWVQQAHDRARAKRQAGTETH
ncbi:glycosyltransferase family 2 protein [Actinophytocola oryzae]|uniref:Glycosyltransferase involved in cell wall biosynthesis n=1 Tax=Actinophytocola oryzae TaxID=502181 RepID=A0A4R7V1Q9_9PSEU|nr:glycosyltransferase family 2 protein [Actinophytocola oryzae]TDV43199.1 glycosyltransferase involved in cell wall biosynthesis [Actinophytocola oryzae]